MSAIHIDDLYARQEYQATDPFPERPPLGVFAFPWVFGTTAEALEAKYEQQVAEWQAGFDRWKEARP